MQRVPTVDCARPLAGGSWAGSRGAARRSPLVALVVLGIVALLVITLPRAWRGIGAEGPEEGGTALAEEAGEVYYCPMHPEYRSAKPGSCPVCGMTLVKLEGEAGGAKEGRPPEGLPPGSVMISAQKQQLIGVTYGEVVSRPLSRTLRTVGRLTYDETRIARVHTKIEGWIEEVFVNFTGKAVRKGEPLFSLYSPELVATQVEYLLALRGRQDLSESPFPEVADNARSLLESSRRRLLLWDITEEQIQALQERGEPLKVLTLHSPIDGYVVARQAYESQRVTPETELYAIADLSTIWVLADIYEYELPSVRLGQEAGMRLAYFPAEEFRGRVTYIYPEVDAMTRTVKVRLEFPNPEVRLKPDMYATVDIRLDYGTQLAIDDDAVLDSGIEKIVFVAREDGYLEPRKVELGAKVDDMFIVLAGLREGERIVTSGNFLIDSESRLKAAAQAMAAMGHGEHAP